MHVVTQILEQKRNPNRRNIYLDGAFAFGCSLNVVARFRLQPGLQLSPDELDQIRTGQVRQECLDAGLRLLQRRQHSRAELRRKLMRQQWGEPIIDGVLDDLQRLGYVDDARFAAAVAASAAGHKRQGRRRAMADLLRSGVSSAVAASAVDSIYNKADSARLARELAQKQLARLGRLEPSAARRRLVAMLQRRGFDYDTIKPVVDQALGAVPED